MNRRWTAAPAFSAVACLLLSSCAALLERPAPPSGDVGELIGKYHITVYYTPRESGFTRARGFDMEPETAAGLGGRTYPADFLRAVRKEGFGKLKTPVNGKSYLQYLGTRYVYRDAPLGNRGNVLVDRKSAAKYRADKKIAPGETVYIDSQIVRSVFGNRVWTIADTGGGLKTNQLDLYWGEDDPRGPGRHIARPRGTPFEHAWDVPVKRFAPE